MTRRALAASAIRTATVLRSRLGYGPGDAVCPFDIAQRLGVEVQFLAAPSLEGMYASNQRAIVVNCLRPSGRRRYTCAHELGHHLHGHGTSFDGEGELVADRAEEFVANQFARALLMPKLAVAAAFARRRWMPVSATAEQVFVVAQDLGVGFLTLLAQMSSSLNLLHAADADRLAKTKLPALRERFVQSDVEHDVFHVDAHWGTPPLDLEVGDLVLVSPPAGRFKGACLLQSGFGRLRAVTPGKGELCVVGRPTPIHVGVSRREFAGRAIYRHLEEVADE